MGPPTIVRSAEGNTVICPPLSTVQCAAALPTSITSDAQAAALAATITAPTTIGDYYFTGVNGGYGRLNATGAASGMTSTPAGWIMVGEEGPEYIGYGSGAFPALETENVFPLVRPGLRDLSRLGPSSGWVAVGLHGPERIFQPGGATVLPHGQMPRFAAGTLAGGSAGAANQNVEALIAEVAALRKQLQGGQVQAMQDAREGNKHLGDINRKTGPGIVPLERRKA